MRFLALLALAPLSLLGAVSADIVPPEVVAEVDNLRTAWGGKGVGISIVRGEETQFLLLGNATDTAPLREDTLFVFASCSKVIVSYAIERLMASGAKVNGRTLDWNTKAESVLGPDWKLPDPYATKSATLLDLAAMRTGQPGHEAAGRDISPQEAVRSLRDLPMTSTMREGFQYSNLNYITLSRIIEIISGKPYHEYAMEMLKEWGMNDAFFNLKEAAATGRLTEGHYHTRDDAACAAGTYPTPAPGCVGEVHNLPNWLPGSDALGLAGGAGLMASLPSAQKMQRAILQRPLDQPVIPTWVRDPGGSDQMYGMGQNIQTYKGVRILGHNGGLPGHQSQMWHAPEKNASVAVFANDSEFSQVTVAIVYTLLESMLGLPRTDWGRMVFDRIKAKGANQPPTPQGQGPPVTGAYCHKGYGRLEFRPADDRTMKSLPNGVSRTNVTVASLDKSIYTHAIILSAVGGAFYNWTGTMDRYDPPLLNPAAPKGTAIVTDKGIGMFTRFSNAGNVPLYPPAVEDVQNRAEVWFDKC